MWRREHLVERSRDSGDHPAFRRVDHRPWPLPAGPWIWRQSWHDLLFAHWPVPASRVRALVPSELAVHEFDQTSWVGVVPFHMSGIARRPLPALPWLSAFPELNLRLYVEHGGRPGVWFLSLDAANPLAVWAARRWFHLPYFHARMGVRVEAREVAYESARRHSGPPVVFRARYRPASAAYEASHGTLEHWLTERYCLYARSSSGRLYRTEIHHPPWPLQRAEAEIERNDLFAGHFDAPSGPPPVLHFARRLDVVVWSPTRLVA
jgi:uncharacterized protein YqjF (DUF2071 family)